MNLPELLEKLGFEHISRMYRKELERVWTNSLIIALDFPIQKGSYSIFTALFNKEKLFVKVGMELFYQEGPAIIDEIKRKRTSYFS